MTPTPEQLAAFADDQLEGTERAGVAAAIAADPMLAQQVEAHRALKARLGRHLAPIAQQPVPDHLAALLRPQQDKIVNLPTAWIARRRLPRWTWIAGPALAASLVLAIALGPHQTEGYADTEVARALDSQLVADQPANGRVKVLLSFRDASGNFCRAYESGSQAAIACRDTSGWKLTDRADAQGAKPSAGQFRQAGSPGSILARAQSMAVGAALDAQQEVAARQVSWLPEAAR